MCSIYMRAWQVCDELFCLGGPEVAFPHDICTLCVIGMFRKFVIRDSVKCA